MSSLLAPTVDPIAALWAWFAPFDSVLVAFSGGVDSAVVLGVAKRAMAERRCPGRVLACIGVSPSLPGRERRAAVALAELVGAPWRAVDTDEIDDPQYAANGANRCYFCKLHLHDHLSTIARAEGYQVVVDGNHADDLIDHRHGIAAAKKHGVRSPLAEVGAGKGDVRRMARAIGLPVWDKPAMACLASRVPHGTPVTPQLLRQIDAAEDVLAELGFTQFRVRHHGDVARIEVPVEQLPRAVVLAPQIVERVAACGYRFVTLDLAGFRSGSLTSVALTVSRTRSVHASGGAGAALAASE
jgi:uncharacterized protein